jgi:hypothetical protein
MADKKISQLTPATTPLGGAEVLPIVQAGATVKASISNVQTAPYSAGTANGVTYLNGSKVLTSGAALTFDGTNLGLGVTPSAWGSNFKAIQLGDQGSLSYSPNDLVLGVNAYRDATNWKYLISTYAPIYEINSGLGYHAWYTTASGTAGSPITFIQALTLNASADLKVEVGNIVQGTAGKGINFTANTNAPGMTSELLNWYEEGTWTPTVTAVSGAYTTVQFQTGRYTRISRMVHIVWTFTVTSKGTGASAYRVADLPFAINQTGLTAYTGSGYNNSTAVAHTIYASGSGTTIDVYRYDGTDPVVVNQGMVGSCTYFV